LGSKRRISCEYAVEKNQSLARPNADRTRWRAVELRLVSELNIIDLKSSFALNVSMQIENFKVFCDLAETGSFTRAAVLNSVTQSAVSQTMSMLERQFNTLLAERSRRNFRLTREGQVVYDYGRELLRAYAMLETRMKEARSASWGLIRVAAIHSLGLYNLPPCLTEFAQAQPTVKVEVAYRRSACVYEEVLSGSVDLGLVAYPRRHVKLELILLCPDSLVFICAPHHPLAKSKTVPLSALEGEVLVVLGENFPSGLALHRLLRSEHVMPASVLDLDSFDAVKSAVEIEAGVGIVPQITVAQEAANRSLVAIPLQGDYSRPLGLLYRKQMELTPVMTELITLLKRRR